MSDLIEEVGALKGNIASSTITPVKKTPEELKLPDSSVKSYKIGFDDSS